MKEVESLGPMHISFPTIVGRHFGGFGKVQEVLELSDGVGGKCPIDVAFQTIRELRTQYWEHGDRWDGIVWMLLDVKAYGML